MNRYTFKKIINFSIKNISIGIMLFSNKEVVYGGKGRVTGIEINLLILHFKIAIVRSGF